MATNRCFAGQACASLQFFEFFGFRPVAKKVVSLKDCVPNMALDQFQICHAHDE